MVVFRLVLVAAIFLAANAMTLAAPSSMAAERVGGEAYGLAVGNPAASVPGAAYVQLPPGGGTVSETSPAAGHGLGNLVGSISRIATRSDGDLGAGHVTSTTTVMDGELLGGVVRVHDVRAIANVASGRPSGGVTYGSAIVAGVAYPNPLPNTRIEVPNVGIVILNEQLVSEGGAAAMIVRAVRFQITEPSLFDLPRGTDLIVGHAAAGVPEVVVGRAVTQSAPTATPVPWAPIAAYRPIDVSLNGNYGDDNDNEDFDFDNGNGNDNGGAGGGGGGGGASPTPAGIVVTVIVIKATATFTPTPAGPTLTPTPTPTP
jgi:hypothetical protein